MSNKEGGVKNEKELKAYIDVVRRDVWHLLLQMIGEVNKPSDDELSVFLLELTKILNQFWRFALPIVRPKQHVMFPDAAETISKNEGLPMLHERFPGLKTLSSCYPWPLEKPNVFPTPVPIGLAGWLAAEVKSTLTAFSASRQPAVWLELGTWMGMSARAMLDVAPASVVIAVDDWRSGVHHPEIGPYMPRLFEIFCDESWEYRDRIFPIKEKTADGMRIVSDLGIVPDFVFIDADHSYDAVRNDFLAALELFPAAIILGDDFGQPNTPVFGVTRAVNEVSSERGLKLHVNGSAWWVDPLVRMEAAN